MNAKTHRGNLRVHFETQKFAQDATRVLIAIISMYLMSQSLQVFVTFWEAIDRQSLESETFIEFYAYCNDVVSILTLLSRYT